MSWQKGSRDGGKTRLPAHFLLPRREEGVTAQAPRGGYGFQLYSELLPSLPRRGGAGAPTEGWDGEALLPSPRRKEGVVCGGRK